MPGAHEEDTHQDSSSVFSVVKNVRRQRTAAGRV